MIEAGRMCACGCGAELPADSKPFRRFVDDRHRKRQHRRRERAELAGLKAAAATLAGAAVVQGGASVTSPGSCHATVRLAWRHGTHRTRIGLCGVLRPGLLARPGRPVRRAADQDDRPGGRRPAAGADPHCPGEPARRRPARARQPGRGRVTTRLNHPPRLRLPLITTRLIPSATLARAGTWSHCQARARAAGSVNG